VRKVDFHLARAFLVPFLVITGVALGLYVVADALGSLENFFKASESLGDLLRRMAMAYLCRLPVFLTPLIPVTLLISGAFAVAYLARNNEITALKASGIGIHRVLAPMFVCATILSLVGFANQELLVPVMERRFLPQLKEWTEGGEKRRHTLRGFIEAENTDYILEYDVVGRTISRVTVIRRQGGRRTTLIAPEGMWRGNGWRLGGKEGVTIKPSGQDARTVPTYLWQTSLTPDDLATEVVPLASRPLRVIAAYARDPNRPLRERRRLRVMLYNRLSYPLAGVALMLAGIPFMLSHEAVRRSRLFGVALCIIIVGLYHAVRIVANDLGTIGELPPALAGVLPVFLFGAVGIYLTDRIRT